jgi:hypothetical protein
MVDENVPHDARRDGEEMLPVVPFRSSVRDEAHQRFLHQRRRVDRLPREPAKLPPCDPMDLRLNQRKQSLERRAVALLPFGQEFRDVAA